MDDNDDDINIELNSCFSKVFIYVYINDTNFTNKNYGKLDIKKTKSGTIYITIDIYKFIYNIECDMATSTEWDYCSQVSESKCKSEDSKICDSRCKWVKCTYKNRKKDVEKQPVSICVPFNTMRDEDFCSDFFDGFEY